MTNISPGWYRDPAEPTTQRYWDGEGWVGSSLPADATPPEGPLEASPAASAPPAPTSTPPGNGAVPGVPPQEQQPPAAPLPPVTPQWPAPGALPPPPGYPQFPPGAPGRPQPHPHPGAQPPPGYSPVPPGFPPPGFPPGYPQLPPGAAWPPGVPFPGVPYVLRPIPRPHGFNLAPLGLRFLARVIDIVAVLFLNVVLNGWLIYQWIKETSGYWSAAMHATSNSDLPKMSSRGALLFTVITTMAIAIWLAYEVPFIGNSGQTLGKRIMGIRVVPLEGLHRLGYGRAFRRWTPLGVPMLFWLISPIFILISPIIQSLDCLSPTLNRPLHLAMHDRSAGTIVVEANKRDESGTPVAEPATVGANRDHSDGGTK